VKQVVFLSTYGENVGDDLIRHGCEYLLSRLLPYSFDLTFWAKSNSMSTCFARGSWCHSSTHRQRALVRRLLGIGEQLSCHPLNPFRYRLLKRSDMIVICGTPLFYFVSSGSFDEHERWPRILLDVAAARPDLPIVTLGCGSIVDGAIEDAPSRWPEALRLVQRLLAVQKLVTCRDATTQQLLQLSTRDDLSPPPILPCPSLWAVDCFRDQLDANPVKTSRKVCISFSTESSAWTLNGQADKLSRRQLAVNAVRAAKRLGLAPCLLAHNDLDAAAIHDMKREFDELLETQVVFVSAVTLLSELSSSLALVTWRVHGAMAARSLGKPALLLRTDSRYKMAEEVGALTIDNTASSMAEINAFLERISGLGYRDMSEINILKRQAESALDHCWSQYSLKRGGRPS
jgi:hypothetical protein